MGPILNYCADSYCNLKQLNVFSVLPTFPKDWFHILMHRKCFWESCNVINNNCMHPINKLKTKLYVLVLYFTYLEKNLVKFMVNKNSL